MAPIGDPDHDLRDPTSVRDDVVDTLLTFIRSLRRADVRVSSNAALVATRALVEVGFHDEERTRAALRAVLVTRPEDVDTFDRLFSAFWRRLAKLFEGDESTRPGEETPDGGFVPSGGDAPVPGGTTGPEAGESETIERRDDSPSPENSGVEFAAGRGDGSTRMVATYSPAGRPETVTVDAAPVADQRSLSLAVDRFLDAVAALPGRRWRRAPKGRQADARRALRRSVATGGVVPSVPERARRPSELRALLLADVSRSVLDTVDRGFLVRFLRTVMEGLRRGQVYFFDSEVREVSESFEATTTADAVRELERAETRWGGGTRIGHAIETIGNEHPNAVDRQTVVLVVSDGLETGDVSSVEAGLSWLSRRARVVLWLNPLAASPAYEPTAAGMAAARPFVDGLFAFTGPEDVAEIARQLEQYGTGGRIGYKYAPRHAPGKDGTEAVSGDRTHE
jgi:uncharacterized protein with von Willebrand factor type A (vWA) domain